MKLLRDASGQGVLEYGLIFGLVAMIVVGTVMMFGTSSSTSLAHAAAAFGTDAPSSSSSGARTAGTRAH